VERLAQGIPSIPGAAIAPFLGQPLVVEDDGLASAPKVVASEESRVIIGAGNVAYVDSIDTSQGIKWQIYRQGPALRDPETQEVLGYSTIYIGDARVTRFGTPATIEVVRSVQEVNRGDRLAPTRENAIPSYSPRAPEQKLTGRVVAVDGGVAETGQFSVIALNRGKRDGLEIGHVLAIYRSGEVVSTGEKNPLNVNWGGFRSWFGGWGGLFGGAKSGSSSADSAGSSAAPAAAAEQPARAPTSTPSEVKLPDERNGLIFVFRVFDRVSYALVMQTKLPIYINDVVQTP